MQTYLSGFGQYVREDDVRSLTKKPNKPKNTENYLDSMWREFGLSPENLPEFIESGPIEIESEGLLFNQAMWQIIKPVTIEDKFVRIKFHKPTTPSLNQHCYRRKEDGKMEPVNINLEGKTFIITLKKLAEMLGRGFQNSAPQGMM